eukprot:3600030-Rhodomonas_salina.3
MAYAAASSSRSAGTTTRTCAPILGISLRSRCAISSMDLGLMSGTNSAYGLSLSARYAVPAVLT